VVELLEPGTRCSLVPLPGGLWLELLLHPFCTEVVVILKERHYFVLNFDGSRELC